MLSKKIPPSHENLSQLEGAIRFLFDKYERHPDSEQIKRFCVDKAIELFRNGIKEYNKLIKNLEKEIWKKFYD